ncbi:MAG: hypothetical protein V1839_00380 [archaeon]
MSQPKSCGLLAFHFSPMLKMKKAQGLPISTIVIAAVCVLVLVVLVIFFSGGFSKINKQASAASNIVEADLTAQQTKCAQWCSQAQNMVPDKQKASSFCKDAKLDIDGDGNIGMWPVTGGLISGSTTCGKPNLVVGGDYSCKSTTATPLKEKHLSCEISPFNVNCPGVSCV